MNIDRCQPEKIYYPLIAQTITLQIPMPQPAGNLFMGHGFGDKIALGHCASCMTQEILVIAGFNTFCHKIHTQLTCQIKTGVINCP